MEMAIYFIRLLLLLLFLLDSGFLAITTYQSEDF